MWKQPLATALPDPVDRCRACLEGDLRDAAAAADLREALGDWCAAAPDLRIRLQALEEVCTVLVGGDDWDRASVQSAAPTYTRKLDEALVIHPRERQERRHRLASFLGRILHLLEGDDAARLIARVTEKATTTKYPQLVGLVVECAGQVGGEPPDMRIARGDDPLFAVFVDRSPYLCIHESYLTLPLSPPEMRFAIARQLQHLRSGYAPLLQISPERLEELCLDEVPFIVRTPLKLTSKAIGWTGVGGFLRRASARLPRKSRTQRIVSTVGEVLPEKDQETILPETVHEWLRSWIEAVEFSADRAGLVVCNSVTAACAAIIRLSPDDAGHLPAVRQNGLARILREDESIGRSTMLRLSELLKFALSKEFLTSLVPQ